MSRVNQQQQVTSSTAMVSDLDWSQVRETVRMLFLSVAQIEMAMREGDDSINTLSASFTAMIAEVDEIAATARKLEGGEGSHQAQKEIDQHCRQVGGRMGEAVIAFQFYDRLSQRLHHVKESLGSLARLVDDPQRLYNPSQWQALQTQIRAGYTMEEEIEMFESVLNGMDVETAIHHCDEQRRQRLSAVDDDSVELF